MTIWKLRSLDSVGDKAIRLACEPQVVNAAVTYPFLTLLK